MSEDKISARGLFYCEKCNIFYMVQQKVEELSDNKCLFCKVQEFRVVLKDPNTKFRRPSVQLFKCGDIIVFTLQLSANQKAELLA